MRHQFSKLLVVTLVPLLGAATAQADSDACDAAYQNYQELSSRSVMDDSELASTVEAAAVRAYCTGQNPALVPPGANPSLLPGIPIPLPLLGTPPYPLDAAQTPGSVAR